MKTFKIIFLTLTGIQTETLVDAYNKTRALFAFEEETICQRVLSIEEYYED